MITSAIEIRQMNKERIREAIQKQETCTKADIVKQTDLSMATCSTALNEMLESNEILKVDQVGAGIGRPSDLFAYNRDYLHVLCICLYAQEGTNTVDLAVADALGGIIAQQQFFYDTLSVETVEALVADHIAEDPLIKTVGLGVPGVVVDSTIESCDIKALQKVDFAKLFREKFDVNVIVQNDMHTITHYLYHQQAHCPGDFAAIYFPGTSNGYVGSGFIVDGHVLRGRTMLSGALWHVAEVFGVSPDEQAYALQDRKAFQKLASQILLTICCTINPSNVVIMGNEIDEQDLAAIRAHCTEVISPRHLPDIEIRNDIFENYAKGLIRLTLDSLLFPFIV
ncbi:ROK family protein [Agathobaculum sp.]|uniref:ROK family protein n=1 Tax=Agathobaculum sp. TaxID=2048138 RepID=UPI002A83E1C5|nr:ROK family protein [Agathobaculum sp.]MDY3619054.1 ROK family protein [Agathobaculum sp.]